MPAYHFYINGVLDVWDLEGQDLIDDAAAKSEATRAFGEILQFEDSFLTAGHLTLSVMQSDRVVIDLVATASTEQVGAETFRIGAGG